MKKLETYIGVMELSSNDHSLNETKKRYMIGYTQGVFDMFHIGHLNLINHAKEFCEHLIVGINTDRLVEEYKHKRPVINEKDRLEIVKSLKAVDECILVDTLDKIEILKLKSYDVIFIGDDWRGNQRWIQTELSLLKYKVEVIYLPYTRGVSSSDLRDAMCELAIGRRGESYK